MTVMTAGGAHARQTFNILPEMNRDQSGVAFPKDVWTPMPPSDRRGRLRYPNQLSMEVADQVVRTYTNEGDLTVDFFNGGGTVPFVCLLRGRRCLASDKNPESLRFTMGRMVDMVARQQGLLNFGAEVNRFNHLQSGPGLG